MPSEIHIPPPPRRHSRTPDDGAPDTAGSGTVTRQEANSNGSILCNSTVYTTALSLAQVREHYLAGRP